MCPFLVGLLTICKTFNLVNHCGKYVIAYFDSQILNQVHISKEFLQLEPIGLVFVFFFALILVIQFTAMLFHRFGTLSHILAATELNFCCNKKSEELSQDALIDKVNYELVSTNCA